MSYIFLFLWLLLNILLWGSEAWASIPKPGAVSIDHAAYLEGTRVYAHPLPKITLPKTKRLTLQEAILLALRNSPEIARSELQRVLDKFALEVTHYQFYPQISVNNNIQNQNGILNYGLTPQIAMKTPIGTSLSVTYVDTFQGNGALNLHVAQPLLKGAGLINLAPEFDAEDIEDINKILFRSHISQIIVKIIQNYRQLVQDQHHLAIQERSAKNTQNGVKQAEIRFKAGSISRADLIEQRAQLATTKLSIAQQKMTNDSNYHAFLKALGLKFNSQINIDSTLDWKEISIPSLSQSMDAALKNNADYQTELLQWRLKKRSLSVAQNKSLWDLELTADTTLGLSGIPFFSATYPLWIKSSQNLKPNYRIGLTLNIPFHDMATKQAILSARIDLANEELNLHQKREDLIADINDKITHLKNEKDSIMIANQAISLKEEILKNTQIKVEYGKETVFTLNKLRDDLIMQQMNLIDQQINFLNEVTNLNETLGKTLNDWHIRLRY